jgi:hypothetical protein
VVDGELRREVRVVEAHDVAHLVDEGVAHVCRHAAFGRARRRVGAGRAVAGAEDEARAVELDVRVEHLAGPLLKVVVVRAMVSSEPSQQL